MGSFEMDNPLRGLSEMSYRMFSKHTDGRLHWRKCSCWMFGGIVNITLNMICECLFITFIFKFSLPILAGALANNLKVSLSAGASQETTESKAKSQPYRHKTNQYLWHQRDTKYSSRSPLYQDRLNCWTFSVISAYRDIYASGSTTAMLWGEFWAYFWKHVIYSSIFTTGQELWSLFHIHLHGKIVKMSLLHLLNKIARFTIPFFMPTRHQMAAHNIL